MALQPRSLKHPPHPSITWEVCEEFMKIRAAAAEVGSETVPLSDTGAFSTQVASGVLHSHLSEGLLFASQGVEAKQEARRQLARNAELRNRRGSGLELERDVCT